MTTISYYAAAVGSFLLHAIVVVLMLSNWQKIEDRELRPQPKVVQARLIELVAAKPKTEVIDLTSRRQAEREAAQRLAQNRLDEDKRLEELRKKEADDKAEQERLEEEQRKQTIERERLEADAQNRADEFQQALMDEEGYQASVEAQQLVDSVGFEIEHAVEQSWNRPPSARRGMEAVLRVSLVPTGDMSSVEILSSSGDSAFDRSAVQAVQKAAPFVAVKEISPLIFEKNFRTFQFRFSPQDLRL